METFSQAEGGVVVDRIILIIQKNKQFLSDIDGAIGDGDHGINMNKGVTLCRVALDKEPGGLSDGLQTLGRILILKIGGSMGPLYGKLFMAFGKSFETKDNIYAEDFLGALKAALDAILTISQAKTGDKTLMDVLIPAVEAFERALKEKRSFSMALDNMSKAALKGRDSTVDMVAKIGRSSRLGERSRGVMDAGAASCYLILESMAESIRELLNKKPPTV